MRKEIEIKGDPIGTTGRIMVCQRNKDDNLEDIEVRT